MLKFKYNYSHLWMLQNLFPYISEGSVWKRSEPGHSYSVVVWSFLEIGKPVRRKAKTEPQMQREEDSGYFKYRVLPISISIWFPLPKMRTPLLLVLFHETLLAGTGKQWGLQPFTLQGQTALSVWQARLGLSRERLLLLLSSSAEVLPLEFAQAASSSSPSGVGNQKRLLAVLSAPFFTEYKFSHAATEQSAWICKATKEVTGSHNLMHSSASLNWCWQCHCQQLLFMASSASAGIRKDLIRGHSSDVTIRWGCCCCLSCCQTALLLPAGMADCWLVKGWQWFSVFCCL